MKRFWSSALTLLAAVGMAQGADDVLVEDFESETYGDWEVVGEAFGNGPAPGALPGQMSVSGYLGNRLVNSFYHGDGTIGSLTSPEFRIERPYLNFLIGGGGFPNETCIQLLSDGEVVRTATGPQTESGGTEELSWESWDVSDLVGQPVTIRVVDHRTGGWGHINIDHIVQSDTRKAAEPATRDLLVEHRYLHLPVKNGTHERHLTLNLDGHPVRQFNIQLTAGEPDFYVFSDVSNWQGKRLTIDSTKAIDAQAALNAIRQSDELPAHEKIYHEKLRPQFHFTSRRGWLNDPNGLVYYKGEWHLFYQHNPFGWNWGNMHWGHAVSNDLFHWKELGEAIHPWSDVTGAAFSGSATVDWNNTSGFGPQAGEPPLVAALTDTDAGESIAYSNDRGRSWSMFEGNPVVKHQGRDPKIVWYEPGQHWVMVVYDEPGDNRQSISFYTSTDLKAWEYQSQIDGFFECPDLFELAVDGDESNKKWVLHAADGEYVLGSFDGKKFTPGHQGKHKVWFGDFYAAQSYSDAPNGRRVQIGWGRGIEMPNMPFNQQMVVPVDLSLRNTPEGPRMFAQPVPELDTLRVDAGHPTVIWKQAALQADPQKHQLEHELSDMLVDLQVPPDAEVTLQVRGLNIVYDATANELRCADDVAPLELQDGRLSLRILVDRASVEVFANEGRVAISHGVVFDAQNHDLSVRANQGVATLNRLAVYPLQSVWDSQ